MPHYGELLGHVDHAQHRIGHAVQDEEVVHQGALPLLHHLDGQDVHEEDGHQRGQCHCHDLHRGLVDNDRVGEGDVVAVHDEVALYHYEASNQVSGFSLLSPLIPAS